MWLVFLGFCLCTVIGIIMSNLFPPFKGPYRPFCMFEPNIFSFHTYTIISQRIKPYFSFPDILQNLLIFQNQIFKRYTHLKNPCFSC
ncbi:hypothetical protein LDENG_00224370 [Lucifuga dentata]|nr:hypothetical protein LDENG_00224370 [Lucifuga dentata]